MPVDRLPTERLRGRIALVTGASRGLGLAVCRQLAQCGAYVVVTARTEAKAEVAAESVRQAATCAGFERLPVFACEMDVTDALSVIHCRDQVLTRFGRIDILVNNAGVFLDAPRPASAATGDLSDLPPDVLTDMLMSTMSVNVAGAMRTIDAFIPGMRAARYGRIVNVSSGMGRYVELTGNSACYRTSKAALNTLSRVLALREAAFNIKINAVCPGWLQTDMGGARALRSVEEGAYGVLYAAALADDGTTGKLLRDGECFGW